MTAAEWDVCTNVDVMVRFLSAMPEQWRRDEGERKLRLWGCACCRQLQQLDAEPEVLLALRAAERLADSLSGPAEPLQAARSVRLLGLGYELQRLGTSAGSAPKTPNLAGAVCALLSDEWEVFAWAGVQIAHPGWTVRPGQEGPCAEVCAQLLRCVIGNPFLPRPAAGAACAFVKNSVISGLARTCYEKGEFDQLPILADALEEAGCNDQAILAHCRARTLHCRGCWVADYLRMASVA